jgi:hypothetical protein
VILAPTGPAGICLLFVSVRSLFDYSAHVSRIYLVVLPSDRGALSHALWERKRIVIVTTFVVWLAITVGFVYGLCSSLPSIGSSDACSQMQPVSRLAHTGIKWFARFTPWWTSESVSLLCSSPTSCSCLLCHLACCVGNKPV